MQSKNLPQRSGHLLRNLLMIVMILFVCSALFFSYQIYETVQEAGLVQGVLDFGNLSIQNPNTLTLLANGAYPAPGDRVNILVLGWDRRPSEPCPCQTDTMILATLDSKTSTAGMVTIPRDLWVPIPGVGEQRIDAAWSFGEDRKYPGGGFGLVKKTVEADLGRKVDYYVLINFDGFRKIVDALGGVDIDVPRPIDDPTYPDDQSFGYIPLHFSAGLQHMDGERALQYARTRHQDSDFSRSRRQIQILMALRDKALRLDLVPQIPRLIQSMWGAVQTDIPIPEAIALAQTASQIRTENLQIGSIDQTMAVGFRTSGGADVLRPDWTKIGHLLDQIIPTSPGAPISR
jgi:polyisoprenyl-teichoic acid--peptidoglycan teichoic acid transferase